MSTLSTSTLPGVGSPLRLAPASNFERMYALDEAWNAQDWETFDAYHDQDVVVYWPGREQTPTLGLPDHRAESERFAWRFPTTRSSTRTTCSSGTATSSSRPGLTHTDMGIYCGHHGALLHDGGRLQRDW